MSWTNSDGLVIYFGAEEALKATGGEYEDSALGGERVFEWMLDLTALTTTAAYITRDLIPSKMKLVRAEVVTQTAATGGTSFSVGFRNTKTATDYGTATAGAISGMLLATHDAEGETTFFTAGTTGAGDKMGLQITTTNVPVGVMAKCAGTYTAGKVRLKLYFQYLNTTD